MTTAWCILFAGIILDIIFIWAFYQNKYRSILFFKTVSSVMFVILGILFTLKYQDTALSWLVVCGLTLGLLGDFFLDAGPVFHSLEKNSFTLGCGTFLFGHLFYIARSLILMNNSGNWIMILYALIGCIIGGLLIKQMFKVCTPPADVKMTGVLYLLVLDFSCFLACGLYFAKAGNAAMAVGTLLFAVSDHMLTYDYFGNTKIRWFHGVLLILYYAAQCCIAFSILG